MIQVEGDGTAFISSTRPSKRAAGWLKIEGEDMKEFAAKGYDIWYRPATGGMRHEIFARHPEASKYARERGNVVEEEDPLTTVEVRRHKP